MPFKDKDKRNAYLRDWNSKNKEKVKQYGYKYLENNPIKKMLKSSKANARSRGLEHSITAEDVVIPRRCPYLDIPLTSKVEGKNTPSTMSLDRIDNTKGYVKGNVQVISNLANLMKSFATAEELITFSLNVLRLAKYWEEDFDG